MVTNGKLMVTGGKVLQGRGSSVASGPGGGTETSLGTPSLNEGRGASSARPLLIRELLSQVLGGRCVHSATPARQGDCLQHTVETKEGTQAMNSKKIP